MVAGCWTSGSALAWTKAWEWELCKGCSAGRLDGLVVGEVGDRRAVEVGEAGAGHVRRCAGWFGVDNRGRRDDWFGGDGRGRVLGLAVADGARWRLQGRAFAWLAQEVGLALRWFGVPSELRRGGMARTGC